MSDFNDFDAASRAGSPITKLEVHHGDVLDAIRATNGGGQMPFHGGQGGRKNEIAFERGEYLIGIIGRTGRYFGGMHVVSITFVTNKKTYGPFGSGAYATDIKEFKAVGERAIISFHGSTERHTDGTEFISTLGYSVSAVV